MSHARKRVLFVLAILSALPLLIGTLQGTRAQFVDQGQSNTNSVSAGIWWQAKTQADFEGGVRTLVDTYTSPGDVSLLDCVYAFQGNGTSTFWRYYNGAGIWEAMPSAPGTVGAGGNLVVSGSYAYALRGNNSSSFWRYDLSGNSWASLASAPANVADGGALVAAGSYIYAFQGSNTRSFWRYSISGNTWSSMTNAPANVDNGGSLVFDGTYIYGLRGNNTNKFYRYNIGGNSWTTMANTPANVGDGGAIVLDGAYLYAFQGNGTNAFWRYNISSDTWSTRANAPGLVSQGGALAANGNSIYGFRGNTTNSMWTYSVSANTWASATAPGVVDWGGSMAKVGPATSGTVASIVFNGGTSAWHWNELNWSETLPVGSNITFEVRASNTAFLAGAATPSWTSLGTANSPVMSGLPAGLYMQWRATLIAATPWASPTLLGVEVLDN